MVAKLNSDKKDQFKKHFNQYITDFEKQCSDGKQNGYTERFLSRFAIIYASLMQAYEWKLVPWSEHCIFQAVKKMYYLSLNCIKDDQTILQEGLDRLKEMLNVKNEHYQNLSTFSSKTDIVDAWQKPNFFGKDDDGKFKWVIPSQTFKSWFDTPKQLELVEKHLDEIIEKDNEGYSLCSLGYGIRKRAICLNRKKLKKLLSE